MRGSSCTVLGVLLLASQVSLCTSYLQKPPAEEECLEYLQKYQPRSDAALPLKYLQENTELALAARSVSSWAQDVPWPVFLNYVLPYASVDEPRDNWRPLFFQRFLPLIQDAGSLSEAALILNENIWSIWDIVFKPNQTPEIMSPFQVIQAGHASCTGLSIFLVNALRSVGIPARMTGTPEWNTETGGNHDWVEVLTESGLWSFTGAAEYTEQGYNHTWFVPEPARHSLPGSRRHAIYAVSWADGEGTVSYPLMWHDNDNHTVSAFDVTEYYLEAAKKHADARLALRVPRRNDSPAS